MDDIIHDYSPNGCNLGLAAQNAWSHSSIAALVFCDFEEFSLLNCYYVVIKALRSSDKQYGFSL